MAGRCPASRRRTAQRATRRQSRSRDGPGHAASPPVAAQPRRDAPTPRSIGKGSTSAGRTAHRALGTPGSAPWSNAHCAGETGHRGHPPCDRRESPTRRGRTTATAREPSTTPTPQTRPPRTRQRAGQPRRHREPGSRFDRDHRWRSACSPHSVSINAVSRARNGDEQSDTRSARRSHGCCDCRDLRWLPSLCVVCGGRLNSGNEAERADDCVWNARVGYRRRSRSTDRHLRAFTIARQSIEASCLTRRAGGALPKIERTEMNRSLRVAHRGRKLLPATRGSTSRPTPPIGSDRR